MRILALETSAKSVSAAITEDGAVLASSFQRVGLTHSRTLLPMVDALFQNAELPPESVDVFAVSAGPGSFTGLRIGVSTIKGLAWALDKPCVGVSTLSAMAHNLAHMDALLVCAMDARRNQVYHALFDAQNGSITRLTEDRALSLDELTAELQNNERRKLVLGDGAELAYRQLQNSGIACFLAPEALRYQNAVGVALAAEKAVYQGRMISAQQLSISYLRIPQAERERAARQSS